MRIKIPGIATLLEHGDLPEDLISLALLELTSEGGATAQLAQELAAAEDGQREKVLERIAAYGRFQRELARAAIVAVEVDGDWEEVELSPDDLSDLPEDDLAMVAEIVQRLRAYDARGVRIGVEPLDRWATFREAHGCPDEDCPGCAKLVAALSSADLGSV
ncbi:MAG: hypothetical protein RMM28_11130 [Thermoleophilia bacterium]|nr:hypothetical protein [Thermoleophilia bacterium]